MTESIISTPREVDLEITSRCNLKCSYCYHFDNTDKVYRDLPLEEWLLFLKELGECHVMQVTLTGGEPFIRKDLPEIIDGIVKNRMRYSILSNGSLITDKIAEVIAKSGRCSSIQVSLDGSNPEIHDRFRGAGAFDKAIRGIRILQKFNLPVTVRLTIHHHNVVNLEKAADFLLNTLGIHDFGTNSAGFFGSCKLNRQEIELTVEDRYQAMKTLLELVEKYPDRINAMAGPLADARTWLKMENARKQGLGPFNNGGRLTGCGCPFSKLSVRSDGALVPCGMIPQEILGWINKNPIKEVWHSGCALNKLRKRRQISLSEIEYCHGCPYIPYCTGNCPGLAYSILGDLDLPSPDACLRSYLNQGGKLP